ncbi:type I restriction-modification system subunit M [Megamonas funiformis]|uniref:type I restriction-modification system subunit M n=1 Tax=Megamonas funiformis TaxID=437897 RepID=UPI000E3F1170|nr:type I restriction-modification system subunit M [Megamonas funiformis]RGJ98531.1 type I restriction-modification system subunit M [Megamonas funiformis]
MSTSDIQKVQQAQLHSTLWDMANNLRGSMEAYEFKSYILGLIFYRYLSEKVEKNAHLLLKDDNISFEDFYADNDEDVRNDFSSDIVESLGYFIAPQYLFSHFTKVLKETNSFDIEELDKAISAISESSLGTQSQHDFEGLFDDMDLKSTKLGKETKVTYYYGQEKTATTYNLARMNMLLHNIQYQHFEIANGDTLEEPAFMDKKFSAVVANPPYSAKWSADKKFLEDERFSPYGKLAPSSKADFAFVCHMLNSLDEDGTMAVVLPHGVLFRGSAEEQIRKVIIRDYNYLDTVIGLPANLFYGTSIPTCILVFKKNRPNKDILFIDASKEFDKGKNQNLITDEHIHKIIETYKNRQDVEKYAHVATIEEIEENDYNLNIPRYVDTFEEEEPVDLQAEFATLTKLQNESQNIDEELDKYFHELGLK